MLHSIDRNSKTFTLDPPEEFSDTDPSINYLTTRLLVISEENLTKDHEIIQRIKGLLSEKNPEVNEAKKRISQAVENFHAQSNRFDKEVSEMSMDLINVMMSGDQYTPEQVNNIRVMIELAKQVCNRFFETASQLYELEKFNYEGRFEEYKGVINLIFFARMKELSLLEKRVQAIWEKKKMDNVGEAIKVNLQLRQEAHEIDQMIKIKEVSDEKNKMNQSFSDNRQLQEEEYDLQTLGYPSETPETKNNVIIQMLPSSKRLAYLNQIMSKN